MSQQIQATFVRSAKKPGCNMVKVIIPGRKQEGEWVDCPQNVKNFAGKAFQEGEQVVLTGDLVNNKYNVTRIEKVGGVQQSQPTNTQPPTQTYTPSPVQAPQYVGNLKMPVEYMKPKTPEESAQILRLSVYGSACEAVKALTGQVDLNSICDAIDAIYERGLNKVK